MANRRKNIPNVVTQQSTLDSNIALSRLGRSVVGTYVNSGDSYNTERYDQAVEAFRRETAIVMDFCSPFHSVYGTLRQESIKLYIIKVLLFVGTPPTGNGLAVLARLMEILTLYPEILLEDVISDFAKTHAATVDSVTRVIEKYFNIYDNYFYDRVVALTGSHPMTAKDVLCDLSVFIRAKFMSKLEL